MTDFTSTPFTLKFKADVAKLRQRIAAEEAEKNSATICPFCGALPQQRHDPNCGLS